VSAAAEYDDGAVTAVFNTNYHRYRHVMTPAEARQLAAELLVAAERAEIAKANAAVSSPETT
jgi:hypothetical protein